MGMRIAGREGKQEGGAKEGSVRGPGNAGRDREDKGDARKPGRRVRGEGEARSE
jgi:hypothetical protein